MFLICDAEYSSMQTRYYSLLQNIDCSPLDWKAFHLKTKFIRKNYYNFNHNALKSELVFPQGKQHDDRLETEYVIMETRVMQKIFQVL